MKTKIFDALKQQYKGQYGLSDSDWSELATTGAACITDEGQISAYVQGVESIVKRTQSANDTIANLRKQSEQKPIESKPTTPPAQGFDQEGFFAKLNETLQTEREANAATIKALNDKIFAFETQKTTEQTIAQAKAEFFKNPATKQYANEGSDAWERAMEIYEVSGKEFSSADLVGKATSYFDKLASRSGYDAATFVPSDATKVSERGILDDYIEQNKTKEATQAEEQKRLTEFYGIE